MIIIAFQIAQISWHMFLNYHIFHNYIIHPVPQTMEALASREAHGVVDWQGLRRGMAVH